MRKFLLVLTALASVAAVGRATQAAPVAAGSMSVLDRTALLQPVQYYENWREREWHRREAFERFQRREARREWRHRQGGHHGGYEGGYGPGYGGGHGRQYSRGW